MLISKIKNIWDLVRPGKKGYQSIALSAEDIEEEKYKRYLGGEAEGWELRGKFQLYFLRKMGLLPSSKLLDVGCGPLRAGVHLIEYLDTGNYWGCDYNESFITAARKIAGENDDLSGKEPVLRVIDNFDFSGFDRDFDFMILFSVLNHCSRHQRSRFLKAAPHLLKERGKLYITHSHWFHEALRGTPLSLKRVFNHPGDIDPELRMSDWGFPEKADVYPILELVR